MAKISKKKATGKNIKVLYDTNADKTKFNHANLNAKSFNIHAYMLTQTK